MRSISEDHHRRLMCAITLGTSATGPMVELYVNCLLQCRQAEEPDRGELTEAALALSRAIHLRSEIHHELLCWVLSDRQFPTLYIANEDLYTHNYHEAMRRWKTMYFRRLLRNFGSRSEAAEAAGITCEGLRQALLRLSDFEEYTQKPHDFCFDHKYLEPTKDDYRWVAIQAHIPASCEEAGIRINEELLMVKNLDFIKRGKARKIARRRHIMLIHELQCRWGLVDQAKSNAKTGSTSPAL